MYKSSATLDDLYRLALPSGTRLLAGEEFLYRSVSWACSLRPSPPAFPKLDGNELALIDMEDLQRLDPKMRLDRVVRSLQNARVSAIAVLGAIDDLAVQSAEAAQLALFKLPAGESLVQIERSIIRFIVDRSGYMAQRSAELQHELNQIALDSGGLGQIADHISRFAQQPLLLLREDGKIAASAGLDRLPAARRQSVLEQVPNVTVLRSWTATQSIDNPSRAIGVMPLGSGPGAHRQVVVAPIVANEAVHGYCMLLREESAQLDADSAKNGNITNRVSSGAKGSSRSSTSSSRSSSRGGVNGSAAVLAASLTAVEEIAVLQGAAAAALEWAKQNAVGIAEERMRAAFVDELLAAEVADEQAWIQRGETLGYDLTRPHVAWMVEAEGISDWPRPLLRFVEERVHAPYSRRDGCILLFWPIDNPKSGRELKAAAHTFVEQMSTSHPNARLVIGIGRPGTAPSTWRQSQQQARESWRLGKEWKAAPLTYFGDLGLYQLLTALGGNPEAARFFRKTLGRLLAHDEQHNAELVDTLEAFFICHGNLSQTSTRLHVHRNTLTYRLNRISSITRLDLNDPDARFSLQLALKLRPVMR